MGQMRKTYLWMAGSSCLAICACGPAWAQTQGAGTPSGEDAVTSDADAIESNDGEIIVTARRREERLQDVPVSVIALSGDALIERGVTRLEDIQNAVSGVKVEPQNNRTSTPQVTIRGQRQYGVLEAQDPPTAFYFAEAPVAPIQGFNAALYDLASVQVLKGPQGTLFGRNTTGGAVLVTPNKPTDELGGSLTGTLGNYETYGLQGFVNLPIAPTLSARVSGYYREHDGYARYISPQLQGQKAYAERIFDVRGSLLWTPSSVFENYLVFNHSTMRSTANPAVVVAVNPLGSIAAFNGTGARAAFPTIGSQVYTRGGGRGPRDALSDFPQFDRVNVESLVNVTTIQMTDNLTLKNVLSYRNMNANSQFNVVGVSLPAITSSSTASAENFSEELQFSGEFFDRRLTVTAGVFYSQLDAYSEAMTGTNYLAPPVQPSSVVGFVFNAKNESVAAYAQATFKITDELSFTAGGRITEDRRDVEFLSRNTGRLSYIPVVSTPFCYLLDDAGVRLPPDSCSVPGSVKYSEPTYTLSLDYHFTPDIMAYVTRRTGYRSGGFNQRAFNAAQRAPFSPETSLDHEIGIKAKFDLGDWQLRTNVAAYYDEYKDLQKTVLSFVNNVLASSIFNAAEGWVRGVELDAELRSPEGFSIGGNMAYTDTGYDSYPFLLTGVTNGLNNTVQDFSDRKFAGIPEWQFALYANYDLPLSDDIGKITLSTNYSYQDGSFVSDVYQSKEQIAIRYTAAQLALLPDGTRPYKTKSYQLVNARVNWANVMSSPVSLAFYINNLTNAAPEVGTNPNYESLGTTSVSFGPPRTFGIDLKYDF